ncbi:hypothetical protein K8R42_00280 [bacterium]|nr:hypothetical protein [bacterium]
MPPGNNKVFSKIPAIVVGKRTVARNMAALPVKSTVKLSWKKEEKETAAI